MSFFSLKSEYDYTLSVMERLGPFIFLFFLIALILLFKDKFRNNSKLDIIILYGTGIVSSIFLLLYYFLQWSTYGFNCDTVPLHICFISNILCIFLCFNKNKSLFNFLIFTGILGGIVSLIMPDLTLSYRYFRYYQFYVCHISIIIIPLYFLIVHNYFPSFKSLIKTFILLQLIGVVIGTFNEIFKTNYMFISFKSNFAAENSILEYLGNSSTYWIKLDLITLIILICWYLLLILLKRIVLKFSSNLLS